MTGKSSSDRGTTKSDIRAADRWLIGLVLFLIALVIVSAWIGGTALWRQGRATCYQLRAAESGLLAEKKLASNSTNDTDRRTHEQRAHGLRVYASGLRAIVPSCPSPSPLPTPR